MARRQGGDEHGVGGAGVIGRPHVEAADLLLVVAALLVLSALLIVDAASGVQPTALWLGVAVGGLWAALRLVTPPV